MNAQKGALTFGTLEKGADKMITGNETNGLYNITLHAIMNEVYHQSFDGGDINDAARDSINRNPNGGVYEYVYDVYTPSSYNRRYESGGLADDGNLVTIGTTVFGNRVDVTFEDRTRENGDGKIIPDPAFYVSDIVESGHYGARWPSPLYYTQWARPYLDPGLADECVPGGIIDQAITDSAANVGLVPW